MASLLTGNKFDPSTDVPDLTGRALLPPPRPRPRPALTELQTYVVTGGSAGIGFGIVAHLLQHNAAKIYLLSNKEEHAVRAREALKEWGDASRVEWKKCDLEDLGQVDEVAKELSRLDRIDGLVCNAGLGVGVYNETKDGIDSHMQVNFISQFHLTLALLPVLQQTADSRLVLQSSDLHRAMTASAARFRSLAELNTDIGPALLYNRTKLAQVLFVRALARRARRGELGFDPAAVARRGPWMNATHPGAVATDQTKQAEDAYGALGKVAVAVVKPFMKDPVDAGCRPALFAATSADVAKEGIQGAYIVPDREVTEPSGLALDERLAEDLWLLTERILADRLGSLPYRAHHVDPTGREGVRGQTHARG